MMYRSNTMLSVKEVAKWLGVSQSAIYKWVSEGSFPKPYKLGNGEVKRSASRWKVEDIEVWLEDRRDD